MYHTHSHKINVLQTQCCMITHTHTHTHNMYMSCSECVQYVDQCYYRSLSCTRLQEFYKHLELFGCIDTSLPLFRGNLASRISLFVLVFIISATNRQRKCIYRRNIGHYTSYRPGLSIGLSLSSLFLILSLFLFLSLSPPLTYSLSYFLFPSLPSLAVSKHRILYTASVTRNSKRVFPTKVVGQPCHHWQ